MGGDVVILFAIVVARGAVGVVVGVHLPVGCLRSQLHIHHGIRQAIILTKRHNAVVEVLHNAPLSHIELLVRPHAMSPDLAVVV